MDLVLLAAGFATRLEPLTIDQPKHLLPLKSGIFADRMLEQLKKVEQIFSRKVLITNDRYLDKFIKWQESSDFKVEIFSDGVNSKDEKLGATGDLIYVLNKAQLSEDTLVLAMDFIYEEFDFNEFLDFVSEKKASAIVVRREEDEAALRAGSCVQVNENDKVIRFQEKPETPFSKLYGVPYYFVKASDLEKVKSIPKELWDNCGQIAAKLCSESDLYAFQSDGNYLHMTTIDDYNKIKNNS